VQALDGRTGAIAIDEIVPVGDQVAERAALMAKGNAAVHAARGLILQGRRRVGEIDLLPVLDAFVHWTRWQLLPRDFDATGGLSHDYAVPTSSENSTCRASRAARACASSTRL